ncbi:hypothetical protein RND81_03G055200 [Saponaria officinalis]|uniref:Uncharacterized protein n=1 Tax=Saponaria officinalis TaxID=3572 RepID=A0AAW1LYV2_SAPOF
MLSTDVHILSYLYSLAVLISFFLMFLCYLELGGCSYLFSDLARDVPQLQTLSLLVTNEVLPLPPSTTMSFLKRLDLHADIPRDFDLLIITHMLYACPILATLNIEVSR